MENIKRKEMQSISSFQSDAFMPGEFLPPDGSFVSAKPLGGGAYESERSVSRVLRDSGLGFCSPPQVQHVSLVFSNWYKRFYKQVILVTKDVAPAGRKVKRRPELLGKRRTPGALSPGERCWLQECHVALTVFHSTGHRGSLRKCESCWWCLPDTRACTHTHAHPHDLWEVKKERNQFVVCEAEAEHPDPDGKLCLRVAEAERPNPPREEGVCSAWSWSEI